MNMNRSEIVKDLFKKSILPIAAALILFSLSRVIATTGDGTEYITMWVICGIPFGIGKLRTWICAPGGSLGVSTAIFVLNFVLAGFIGGFILIRKLLIAIYYIPVSIIRLVR